MSYTWYYKKPSFTLLNHQDNQSHRQTDKNNHKVKKKAYLNPDIVNYEYIKSTLSTNLLQTSNKIHVNPYFRGNGVNKVLKKNVHYKNIHQTDTIKLLNEPGSSNMSNLSEINNKSPSFDNKNLSNAKLFIHQSTFNKVDVDLKRKNDSQYSWSNKKSTNNPNSAFVIHREVSMPSVKLVENKHTHTSSESIFKYTSKNLLKITDKNFQNTKNSSIFKSKTKIINESKTKLLSNASPKTRFNFKDKKICSPKKRHLTLSRFVYNNKISPITKVAKAVKTKYKYINNLEQNKKSKYKIDKRSKLQETIKNKLNIIQDIRKLFPNNSYYKINSPSYKIYHINNCQVESKRASSWRRNQSSDKAAPERNNKFSNKKVVKIGGILYKSTTTKLTLANKSVANNSSKLVANRATVAAKKNHIVHVRGEKFVLENNGKALRRLNQNIKNTKTLFYNIKRVDIGGVTYVQKSPNVLIRTNVHRARDLVKKAKNKSIALLANLHKKSSMPCMIYHRFGKCDRHTKGLCIYKHDSKNIAVCKNFIKGNCENENCLLSHEVIQEKMATCHFFLNGLCVKENCPFLHVKLNKNVAICEDFLQGFCNLGINCPKRHFHQCPKFDKYGICSSGSKCLYPHVKYHEAEMNTTNLSKDSENCNNKNEKIQYNTCPNMNKNQKKCKKQILKLKENNAKKMFEKAGKRKPLCLDSPNEHDDIISCFPKRIKLEKLPCYIPLKSDSQQIF